MAGVKNTASSVKKKSSTVVQSEDENSLALVQAVQQDQDAPITSSYNDRIRPLLDAVDKLRHLMITREGIQLPTIVVVGDQSSGKSSQDEGIGLPNFLPRTAFLTILQKKVKGISSIPISFAEKVWNYVEEVVISVIMQHSENYYQLQLSFRRAGHNLIAKMKERSVNWVMEIVEMEKLTDYTCIIQSTCLIGIL